MMMFPNYAVLFLVWNALTMARVLGFVLRPPVGFGHLDRSPAQARHVAPSATRLGMMSEDFGEEDSFGARAMQERTHAELQEMVSSHNILAFIKVSLHQGSTSRKTATSMYHSTAFSSTCVVSVCSHVTAASYAQHKTRKPCRPFSPYFQNRAVRRTPTNDLHHTRC